MIDLSVECWFLFSDEQGFVYFTFLPQFASSQRFKVLLGFFTCSLICNICSMYYFVYDQQTGFDHFGVPFNVYSKKVSSKLFKLVEEVLRKLRNFLYFPQCDNFMTTKGLSYASCSSFSILSAFSWKYLIKLFTYLPG